MCTPIVLEKRVTFLEKVDHHMVTAYFIYLDKDLVSGQSFVIDSALEHLFGFLLRANAYVRFALSRILCFCFHLDKFC